MSPRETMTEKETPTVETPKPEAEAPQVEESTSAAEGAASSAAGGLRLVAIGLKSRLSGGRGGRILGVLVFLAISAAATFFLRGGLVFEAEEKPEVVVQPGDHFPSVLSPGELVQMGEGALQSQDVEQASRYYEEARVRAERDHPDDVNLSVDVFDGLARIADERGRPRVAELYRNYIRTKQAELGSSLPLFSEAERLFRAEDWRGAKSSYARFLLMRGSLGPAGERYVAQAKRRLAEIWEIEFQERSEFPASLSKLAEPEGYFHARR